MNAAEGARRAARVGVAYGLAAYLAWGLLPIYFKAVHHVAPLEVLAHRVVWSVVLLNGVLALRRRAGELLALARSRRALLTLVTTATLIAFNWYLYIWAIAHGHLLQASLGYFINPLLNVLLGYLVLGERLDRWQKISVSVAGIGVIYMTLSYGQLPWIALCLAGSFGLYGLLRKTAAVGPLAGLAAETTLLLPIALGYLVTQWKAGAAAFGHVSAGTDVLLVSAGAITSLPLIWFTNAARRLRLSTLGFLQYLAPTGQFLLAVLAYGEPFGRVHVVTFACIWVALALYSIDAFVAARRYGK